MTWRYALSAILALVPLAGNLSAGKDFPSTQLIDLTWLDKAMAESDEPIVHEGLPHPLFESAAHESELKRTPTFTVEDQALYQRPLEVGKLDRAKLSEAFSSNRVWVPPTSDLHPPKLCGGFHADYAVTWLRKGQPVARILVCFGCGELRFVGSERDITTDMTKDGRKELAAILTKYRQERPPSREIVEIPVIPLPKIERPKIDYKP